ncbi:N-acetylglucosaminyl deacetylase, LmbE family [Seinonella peptonophila]|uniref:N-acetylglucosaminyl deacetylase, LmbE family n=1 Tax=Seinonella peptonophila TaxID=112248 RepID=A0A1M4X465_9BACL|nr:PIG-L family deacetylase [Seinonella peptonophila]SHE88245.1 N-acetylglucosaminyl deacetylase, LmbE family [Seinonella peptonophila]
MMRWRWIIQIVMSIFILFLQGCSTDSEPKTVIFYSPHADDESLSFGVAIRNYLHKHSQVHLVLLSDGRKSGAFKQIKQAAKNKVSAKDFPNLRIHDFQKASSALGIDQQKQHIHHLENGRFQLSKVKEIILQYEKKYPQSMHISFSEVDMQKDHVVVGKALNQLKQNKQIHHKQNYISLATIYYSKLKVPPYKKETLLNVDDAVYITHALKVYETWNPKKGFYKTGGFSVPEQFQIAHQEHFNRVSLY